MVRHCKLFVQGVHVLDSLLFQKELMTGSWKVWLRLAAVGVGLTGAAAGLVAWRASRALLLRREGPEVILEGKGQGYENGLCQRGAKAMAERGQTTATSSTITFPTPL